MSKRHKIDQRTQKQQVLDHLRTKGSITHMEALINYGITRLAARVEELRKDGYVINTVMGKDERGAVYARYYPVQTTTGWINRHSFGPANDMSVLRATTPPPRMNIMGCHAA